uniref:Uncharacterized protein n=1 Tax=Cercocebus atys TaxID=9531 RepID=A0A2K5L143_CERAT
MTLCYNYHDSEIFHEKNEEWRQFVGLSEASLMLNCDFCLNKVLCNCIFNDKSLPCNFAPQKRKAWTDCISSHRT